MSSICYTGFDATMEIGDTSTPIVVKNAKVIIDQDAKHSTNNDVSYGKTNISISNLAVAFEASTIHNFLRSAILMMNSMFVLQTVKMVSCVRKYT